MGEDRPPDRDQDDPQTFADTKAEQDEFEQHLREGDDFDEAAEKQARGIEPEHEPDPSNSMP